LTEQKLASNLGKEPHLKPTKGGSFAPPRQAKTQKEGQSTHSQEGYSPETPGKTGPV